MKKLIIIGSLLIAVLIAGALFWKLRPQKTAEPAPAPKKRIVQPVNIIPQEERPYIAISPLADGKNIRLTVHTLQKAATDVEYELEYQAGTLLQGAFGSISLTSLPADEQVLLGSCSAGGACTYHQDVKGGALLSNFGGPEDFSIKTEWKYIDNAAKETSFSSKDGKFQIDAKDLAKVRYLIISQSSGIPSGYTGKIASEPYALELGSSVSGKAELSIRSSSEEKLTMLGWNGTSWETFETTQDGKLATATVQLMQLYVVVTQ